MAAAEQGLAGNPGESSSSTALGHGFVLQRFSCTRVWAYRQQRLTLQRADIFDREKTG